MNILPKAIYRFIGIPIRLLIAFFFHRTIFFTRTIFFFNGEKIVFNKRSWENLISACKKMKLKYYLTAYTKVNSKWIRDLNIKLDTVKLCGKQAQLSST